MQELIEQHQMKQQAVKAENQKLLKAIQDGRAQDIQQNQGLIDGIHRKDKELDDLEKKIQSEAKKRQNNLRAYNQECESANLQTQKTEALLKEKDAKRYEIQAQR